ncbi:MAG: hypothetical protein R3Y45_02305 [Bacillota bacterium]
MDCKVIKLIDFYNQLNSEFQISREEFSRDILSKFTCGKNSDENDFLHNTVFVHEDSKKSVTYLMLKDNQIMAYFSLAIQMIELEGVSKNQIKKVTQGTSPMKNTDGEKIYSSYLVGHFSKNDSNEERGFGDEMFEAVYRVLNQSQELVGGAIVYLDCLDELITYYKKYGFKILVQSREIKTEDGKLTKTFNKMYRKIPLIEEQ